MDFYQQGIEEYICKRHTRVNNLWGGGGGGSIIGSVGVCRAVTG